MFHAILEAVDTIAQNTGTGTSTTTGAAPGAPGGLIGLIFGNPLFLFIAMGLIMYFLIYRPNQKKQKERANLLSSVKKNDKVVTIGGIIGTVAAVKKDLITLKVGDKTRIDFRLSAIDKVITGSNLPEDDKNQLLEGQKK